MRITLNMLGPNMAMKVTATIRKGMDRNPSVICIRTPSIQPLYTPLITATRVPIAPETKAARKPTVTEIRAPQISRLKISRPWWSVPSRCLDRLGGANILDRSPITGSKGATQRVKMAKMIIVAKKTNENRGTPLKISLINLKHFIS